MCLVGEMWVDGVFMGQICLVRYGALIGDADYCSNEAVRQITVFADHCRKGDSGLTYTRGLLSPTCPEFYQEI
jgi:unsaturated rhamnogalacturonyl hydrolase